jgi:hypothetical protein
MDLKEIRLYEHGLDSSGSEQEPVDGSCKQDNEPECSINGREFLHQKCHD